MSSVASQLIEEVIAHAQSDSLEDAREICADGTHFPINPRTSSLCTFMATEQSFTTVNFAMSVYPSVRLSAWKNSAPSGRIFMERGISVFYRRSVDKIEVSLISDMNNGYFT